MRSLLLFALLALQLTAVRGQVVINEVATTNTGQHTDEDGELPDWIELFNAGTTPENLEQWRFEADGNGWVLPQRVLQPGEHLVVNASGKDRITPVVVLPAVDHWETAVHDTSVWNYFAGTSEPQSLWNTVGTANAWPAAMGGFGYGDDDDTTMVAEGTVSLYLERTFFLPDAQLVGAAILSVDYDDGFVAYLNGMEIARSGMIGTPDHTSLSPADHEAVMFAGGIPTAFAVDTVLLQSILQTGMNKLALQIHNSTSASADLTARAWLHLGMREPGSWFYGNPEWFMPPSSGGGAQLHTDFKLSNGERVSLFRPDGVLQDSITAHLQVGHSRARITDGGPWCFTDTPTPGATNVGTCYVGYASAPVIAPVSGFYAAPLNLTIGGNGVHYTLNGDVPDLASTAYSGPLNVATTTVIRARRFQSGMLPSEVAVASYFINEATTLPVVHVITAPGNLFNDGSGGPAVYDNALGKTICTVQYFDAAHVLRFTSGASVAPVGNSSLSLPQKSLQFCYDEDYGAEGDIAYNIFSEDKPGLGPSYGFRVRNTDDDFWFARIRDLVANRLSLNTHSAAAAYQNVTVMINGVYWGHYGARELLDEHFMRDNLGADPDRVDMIRASNAAGLYDVEEGSDTGFFAMSDALINGDLSSDNAFLVATAGIDLENWVDYFASNIYLDNQDWFPSIWANNTEIARARSPRVPWSYIMWDVGYSQALGGWPGDDLLSNTLESPAYPNRYTDMMNQLLGNASFRNHFINRFADLLNLHWAPDSVIAVIDRAAEELAPEINAQAQRWGTADPAVWSAEVGYVRDFHLARPTYQRNQIQDHFSLTGQVEVTLQVDPPGAGVVKISTIIPPTYPWTGVYFHGNPVKLTAIPNPGYSFVDWSPSAFIAQPTLATFTSDISISTTFTAHFTGSPAAANLIFAELNYHSDSTLDAGDWVELKNASSQPLDISDWSVGDGDFFHRFTIPTGTVLSAQGRIVLCEDSVRFSALHPDVGNAIGQFGFEFSNAGEPVRLFDRSGTEVAQFTYLDERPWPVTPDGYGRTMELAADGSTPGAAASWFDGCMTGSPGVPYSPCGEEFFVDEINYKSAAFADAGDWVELRNNGAVAMDLSGWSMQDEGGNTYLIPAGVTLEPGAYHVLFQDALKFVLEHPGVANSSGPFGYGFSGAGDVIALRDDDGVLHFSVAYDDESPFPIGPDGDGYCLQLAAPGVNVNAGINWIRSCLYGSPGEAFDIDCSGQGLSDPSAYTVSIFPNPADATLTIAGIPVDAEVRIFSATGRLMHQQRGGRTLQVADLASGVYMLQVTDATRVQVLSFVKH